MVYKGTEKGRLISNFFPRLNPWNTYELETVPFGGFEK